MNDYNGKRVVILGLARQGLALARFFHSQKAGITISDIAPADRLAEPLAALDGLDDVRLACGGHPLSLLERCDLLCLSGGVPPQIPIVQAARRQGIALSNDAILTLQRSPAPAIGITGSSGKTTTTMLAGLMLEASGLARPDSPASGPKVWVGGNIGSPLIDRLERITVQDWLVLELSSFQLELFDPAGGGEACAPDVAAILNITPNHLDRHPSMAHYAACKANLLRWQGSGDMVILGADNAITGRWLDEGQVRIEADAGQPALSFPLAARRLGFGLNEQAGEGCWLRNGQIILKLAGREQPLLAAGDIRLRGRHNVLNVMAACAISAVAGVSPEAMAQVARSFPGVAHRLEPVRERDGVQWINDSIATAPERAAAALRSFDEPIILLAGGRDKKLPWQEFAALAHRKVRHLVLFGEAAGLIARAMADYEADHPTVERLPLSHCAGLPEAVETAARLARPGDVVLLSPGGASYDAYKDFEARGRHFRALVSALS